MLRCAKGAKDLGRLERNGEVGVAGDVEFVGVGAVENRCGGELVALKWRIIDGDVPRASLKISLFTRKSCVWNSFFRKSEIALEVLMEE